jgi:hypothetical protein
MAQVASLAKEKQKHCQLLKSRNKYPEYVKYVDPFLINTIKSLVVMQCSCPSLTILVLYKITKHQHPSTVCLLYEPSPTPDAFFGRMLD